MIIHISICKSYFIMLIMFMCLCTFQPEEGIRSTGAGNWEMPVLGTKPSLWPSPMCCGTAEPSQAQLKFFLTSNRWTSYKSTKQYMSICICTFVVSKPLCVLSSVLCQAYRFWNWPHEYVELWCNHSWNVTLKNSH